MKKIVGSLPFKLVLGVVIGILVGQVANEGVMNVVVTIKYILNQVINFCVPLIIIGFIAPSITCLLYTSSSNPPAKAEQLFYDTLKKISDGGRRLTIVIAGNHDNPDRLVSATPLAMEHGIIMVGTPKTVIPKGQYGSWEVCRSGEGYIKIERKSEQAVVLTVPFPSEKRLEAVSYTHLSRHG